ncbi:hypothetical protein AB0F81_31040 [Actinoplanes sp. NPDC024001]|uniref:hypothetical protein n=1 Tax=Actinoplanes sp. NPDC024001 TaxID=3154598 RepID=UPI0033E14881
MTVHTMATPQREQTARLLVLLRRYVVDQLRQYPFLLPSVQALREAARAFGRNDLQQAHRKGMEAYQFIMRTRDAYPGMPLP